MTYASLREEINSLSTLKPSRHHYDLTNLADCVVRHLADGLTRSCLLVSSLRRLEKMIVEFDVTRQNGAGPTVRRYMGKVYKGDLGQYSFDASLQLWEAGFRPPSPLTVIRPITYIAEQRLLLEEKASGRLLADTLPDCSKINGDPLRRTASWLARLHGSAVLARPRLEQVRAEMDGYRRKLVEVLPKYAHRIDRLVAQSLTELKDQHLTPLVPSHGDFSPNNVLIGDNGCVTVIDLDTFGRQEQVADVAYFLVQMAIIGFFTMGSFEATAPHRESFLDAYLSEVPSIPWSRLPLYMGMTFLQSLHYELCVFETNNAGIIDLWLENSERCLLNGEMTILGDSF